MLWVYRRDGRVLRDVEAAAVGAAAMTFVVNERERTAVADLVPGAPTEVLRNGIDVGYFRASGAFPIALATSSSRRHHVDHLTEHHAGVTATCAAMPE